MAKHFDANQFAIRPFDLVGFNEISDFAHLFHVQFTRQHHHICKSRVEAQRLLVRNVELGGEMHLLIDGAAIAQHRHVGCNHR